MRECDMWAWILPSGACWRRHCPPSTYTCTQTNKKTQKLDAKKTETYITRSCHCHTFSVLFIIPGGKVSRSISGKCSLVFTETASRIGDKNSQEEAGGKIWRPEQLDFGRAKTTFTAFHWSVKTMTRFGSTKSAWQLSNKVNECSSFIRESPLLPRRDIFNL